MTDITIFSSYQNRIRNLLTVLAAIALLCMAAEAEANAEWVEWIADAELAYETNSNINNAVFESAEENETIVSPFVSLGRVYQLTDLTRLTFTVDATAGFHREFEKLDYNSFGLSVSARHKLGIGPTVPWIKAAARANRINSRSDLRTGQKYEISLQAGKRINERLDGSVTYTYDNRDSDDSTPIIAGLPGNVYDLQGHKVGANVNFLVWDNIMWSLAYAYRRGDIASTCTPDILPIVMSVVDAVTEDDAIPGCAYRMDAATNQISTNLSYTFLQGHAAFSVGYNRREGVKENFSYINDIWRARINYSY